MQDYSPSVSLEWGKSLMEFTPRITTVGDVFGISPRVWVASLQLEFAIVVSWDYDRAAFNLMIFPSLGDLEGVLGESAKKTISHQADRICKFPARDPHGIAAPAQQPAHRNRQHHWQPASQGREGHQPCRPGRPVQRALPDHMATHTFDGSGYKTSSKSARKSGSAASRSPRARRARAVSRARLLAENVCSQRAKERLHVIGSFGMGHRNLQAPRGTSVSRPGS